MEADVQKLIGVIDLYQSRIGSLIEAIARVDVALDMGKTVISKEMNYEPVRVPLRGEAGR
jgi:hypothetical protein